MNFNQYTIKTQEAIQLATQIAQSKMQSIVETGHILKAILQDNDTSITFILKKCNINQKTLSSAIEDIITNYPKGSQDEPYLFRRCWCSSVSDTNNALRQTMYLSISIPQKPRYMWFLRD